MFQNTRQFTPDPVGMSKRKEELRNEIQKMGAYAEDQQKQASEYKDLTSELLDLDKKIKIAKENLDQLNVDLSSLNKTIIQTDKDNKEKIELGQIIDLCNVRKQEKLDSFNNTISDQEQIIASNKETISNQDSKIFLNSSTNNNLIQKGAEQSKIIVKNEQKIIEQQLEISDNEKKLDAQNNNIKQTDDSLTTKNLDLMSLEDKVIATQNIIDSNVEVAKQILASAKEEADKIIQEVNNYKKEMENSITTRSGELSKEKELIVFKTNQLKTYKIKLEKHFNVPANIDIVI